MSYLLEFCKQLKEDGYIQAIPPGEQYFVENRIYTNIGNEPLISGGAIRIPEGMGE